ncbi:GGDEF domain-containing protein [Wukongibacter baidiensis]|uniref:GGDEF domain-containing protein n=1 Tax=Wukongibacter baidiensis TaxID=1723361 RepID=UPI003D7F42B4
MVAIRRKSSLIIIITVCLFLLLSSGGLYTIYLTNIIEPDAKAINKLGIIRGSVQRLVKLELHNEQDSELLYSIDTLIDEFKTKKIDIYDSDNKVEDSLEDLEQAWIHLKQLIYIYRVNPTEYNEKVLIEKSEEIWDKSNHTVFISQILSERKINNYKKSFILFFLNLILVVIIIILIKKYVKDTLESLVNYDGLTKSFNRNYFNEFLKSQIKISERYNKDLSLLILDIDYFKKVNDEHGHYTGDNVLKELSNIVHENIRQSDVFARIGGEEFALILPETSVENAMILSEKLRSMIERHNFNGVGQITISVGISEFSMGDNPDTIYKKADIALYKAKNNGRNRCEIEVENLGMG